MTPTISTEQLVYDCRLMNTAAARGEALMLRDQLVDSDISLDPQALILAPQSVTRIAGAIVRAGSHYEAGCAAALEALSAIGEAVSEGRLRLPEQETPWVAMLGDTLGSLPSTQQEFVDTMLPMVDKNKFRPEEYLLPA